MSDIPVNPPPVGRGQGNPVAPTSPAAGPQPRFLETLSGQPVEGFAQAEPDSGKLVVSLTADGQDFAAWKEDEAFKEIIKPFQVSVS